MLGAATPSITSETNSRSSVKKNGLVKGHAYAIQEVREFDGHSLIRLRNPHGGHGALWNGEWSSGCWRWTTHSREELGGPLTLDGSFWMSFEDFILEFRIIYVCRVFDTMRWNAYPKIEVN